jgi:alpha-D-ribose 1-methylphosphonate 5-triphosphate synthase subunit PhnH
MTEALAISGGFADPVFDGQAVFRGVMDALARPGAIQSLGALAAPPARLTAELAAVALTLCDHDSPVWLAPALANSPAVTDWLRFQTGAPIVEHPAEAMFALVSDAAELPALADFALGTDEYPDRSTTIVLAVATLADGPRLTLRGPGIKESETLSPSPLPAGFVAQWARNGALFPRGVDVILAAPGQLAALPRTCKIKEA